MYEVYQFVTKYTVAVHNVLELIIFPACMHGVGLEMLPEWDEPRTYKEQT